MMLLIAAVAVDASAQSSKIEGKWQLDEASKNSLFGNDVIGQNMNCDVYIDFFDSQRAKFIFDFSGNEKVDSNVTLSMEFFIYIYFNWSLSDNVLCADMTTYDFHVGDVKFIPSSPVLDALIPEVKSEIDVMMKNNMGSAYSELLTDANFNITFVDYNHIKMSEGDTTWSMYRVVE